MDIEALIENLEALDDSLKTTTIRESENLDDFRDCVKKVPSNACGPSCCF